MRRLAAMLAAMTACASAGATTPGDVVPEQLTLSTSDLSGLADQVRDYYEDLEQGKDVQARKQLEKLQSELDKAARKHKVDDVLALVPDVREMLRLGSIAEDGPKITANGSFGLRPVDMDMGMDEKKDLKGIFDGKLKAYVSVPRDHKNVLYPVVLALHPVTEEKGVPLDQLRAASDVDKEVRTWVTEAYPKEFLAAAIVVAPVMDLVVTDPSGLTASRPSWEDPDGVGWALSALAKIVFNSLNHDTRRVFIDGHGSAARAALLYCANFPGLQAGAILRGPGLDQIQFTNCKSAHLLFLGEEARGFYEKWKAAEGFDLTYQDAVDAATLTGWITDHPKELCPQAVELLSDNPSFASAYWIRVTDFDRNAELGTAHVMASYDREKNEIVVATNARVRGFVVYLNDVMIDMSKEFKIKHKLLTTDEETKAEETVRFEGTKHRILEDTLQLAFYRQHGNIGEAYVTQLRIDL